MLNRKLPLYPLSPNPLSSSLRFIIPPMSHPARANKIILAVLVVCLLVLTFGLQLAWTPRVSRTTADSGLFAYIGQQILGGRLPYRDAWDHKPPGVFYVDALAMRLLGQNPWALWWLALVWIGLTGVAFFLVLAPFTGPRAAFRADVVVLVTRHYPG